jgi:hypothetical protein
VEHNTAHGILVQETGYITLTGVPGTTTIGDGTVVANGNTAAGVWIQQTVGGIGTPTNVVTGLVAALNTAGNGMRIVAGSNVTVRNSVFLASSGSGVFISANGGNGGGGGTSSIRA